MSINVTVHGNPISIKKGKMVTYDADSEFERRRRIRLQQVRQQSKEIAADVRNRVRKEKDKHLSKAEQKGEQDLKRWQARKLLSLQQQYQDCLKEVGSAHTKAVLEPDPDETLHEIASKNRKDADTRGKIATEKAKKKDKEKKLELEQAVELKKNTRKIENTRAAMVSKLNQNLSPPTKKKDKKKRKKITTDVTISKNVVTDSDVSESYISDGENISANIHYNNTPKKHKLKVVDDISSPEISPKSNSRIRRTPKKQKRIHNTSSPKQNSPAISTPVRYVSEQDYSPQTDSSFGGFSSPPSNLSEDFQSLPYRSVLSPNTTPPDSPKTNNKPAKQFPGKQNTAQITRISERIQQRNLQTADKEICTDDNHFNFIHNIPKVDKNIDTNHYVPKLKVESYKICDIESDPKPRRSENQLPFVPTTSLLPDSCPSTCFTQPTKVKYYDHLNRFSKEYTEQPIVKKISKNSIQVHPPSDRSENDFYKTMHARDKIAHERGVKAMEKKRIEKDYRQLMEELPLLQRQERLASMRLHKPAFHMPENRLEDLEKRRQNRIESIFEKYYHKSKSLETPIITLRPVQKTPPAAEMKLPFRALDVTESPVELNVAEWKSEETSNSLSKTTSQEDNLNKQKALLDLLQRVNKQRELLLQEVSTLPSSSNLQKILQDEEILKLAYPCDKDIPKLVKESPQDQIKTFVSTGTSPLSVKSPLSKISKGHTAEKESHKRGPVKSSSSDSSEEVIKKKKHKKVRSKKQTTLIKNEGTQTSPMSSKKSSDSHEEPKKVKKNEECNCEELDRENNRKVCEIIIKMDQKSQVNINTDQVSQPSVIGKKSVILNVTKPNTKITIRSPNNDVSSSTTYMSLPEVVTQQNVNKPSDRQLYKDLLHRKPQQTNIDRPDSSKSRKKVVPHPVSGTATTTVTTPDSNKKEISSSLLKYIQKLLSMSRQSIDDLTVSTISDVTTPGSSIVETMDNSPLVRLQNVMQYYNLSFNDIQKHLTSSSTSRSSTEYSPMKQKESEDICPDPVKSSEMTSTVIDQQSRNSPRTTETAMELDERDSKLEVSKLVIETFGLNSEDLQDIPYANILSKYTELTQTCCDKISKLTAMIDKVRLEKEKLLSPTLSDKYETSVTSYMDLPKLNNNDSTKVDSNQTNGQNSSTSSSSSSLSQDAVDKYLLAIDKEPLKYTPKERRNDSDENIPVSDNVNNNKQGNFIPMLQGIPKYSDSSTNNQAMNFINSPIKQFLLSKPKPPPTLLQNAARYNINIDMTPHELSTIVELDTVASSRNVSEAHLNRPLTPEEKVPSRDETVQEEEEVPEFVTLTPIEKPDYIARRSSLKKSSRSSSPSKPVSNTELSGVQPLVSDRSTSSPEDMETILRNMGLGWAVSTLKKTHEALALSSSSSSVETSFRKRVSFKESSSNSNSDISLKEVLSREFMKKISSSSFLSDSSKSEISPHLRELYDLSEIREPIEGENRSQQRTSTPVHHSKSTDSKNNLFAGDSDLSSVRMNSEENFFLSIPSVSLDTNKSLNKSKV